MITAMCALTDRRMALAATRGGQVPTARLLDVLPSMTANAQGAGLALGPTAPPGRDNGSARRAGGPLLLTRSSTTREGPTS